MIRIITSNSRSFKNTILVGFLPFGPIVWRRKESAGGRPVTEAVLQEEAMEATSGTAASETRMAAFTTSHTAVHRLVRIGKKNLRCCLYSVSEPVIYFPYLFFWSYVNICIRPFSLFHFKIVKTCWKPIIQFYYWTQTRVQCPNGSISLARFSNCSSVSWFKPSRARFLSH